MEIYDSNWYIQATTGSNFNTKIQFMRFTISLVSLFSKANEPTNEPTHTQRSDTHECEGIYTIYFYV